MTNTKHVYAALIKKWADGAEIEYYDMYGDKWRVTNCPSWSPTISFRLAVPQWQRDLLDAVERGEVVEYRLSPNNWVASNMNTSKAAYGWGINPDKEDYRIKPKEVAQWRKDMAKALREGKVVEFKWTTKWSPALATADDFLNPKLNLSPILGSSTDGKEYYRVRAVSVVRYITATGGMIRDNSTYPNFYSNIKATFDPTTGQPTSLELIGNAKKDY